MLFSIFFPFLQKFGDNIYNKIEVFESKIEYDTVNGHGFLVGKICQFWYDDFISLYLNNI